MRFDPWMEGFYWGGKSYDYQYYFETFFNNTDIWALCQSIQLNISGGWESVITKVLVID